jgi:hypothetical protein
MTITFDPISKANRYESRFWVVRVDGRKVGAIELRRRDVSTFAGYYQLIGDRHWSVASSSKPSWKQAQDTSERAVIERLEAEAAKVAEMATAGGEA